MAIPLSKYLEIKNNYCIGYYGSDKKQIEDLISARKILEDEMHGIKVYISCNEEMKQHFKKKKRIIFPSEFNDYRGKMAYYRELKEGESAETWLNESKIEKN